jgi:hypothetical protein
LELLTQGSQLVLLAGTCYIWHRIDGFLQPATAQTLVRTQVTTILYRGQKFVLAGTQPNRKGLNGL